jgi:response regulator of citrate/malate metabolism
MDRIRCVIVDDDVMSRELMLGHCRALPYVDIAGTYNSSKHFVESLPSQKFDLCLLGLNPYGMSGLRMVEQLDGQSVIFVTGVEDMLKEALSALPVDIVLKPVELSRFRDAMTKAKCGLWKLRLAANILLRRTETI